MFFGKLGHELMDVVGGANLEKMIYDHMADFMGQNACKFVYIIQRRN